MSTDFQPDFYVTCATVIPVLFVFLAVEKGPYGSVLQSWRKMQESSLNFQLTTLNASRSVIKRLAGITAATEQDVSAEKEEVTRQPTSANASSRHMKIVRDAGTVIGGIFVVPFLLVLAGAIVWAGAIGEGLAIYVLYQWSDSPQDRLLVLVATLIMVGTVAIGPFLAYLRGYLEFILSVIKFQVRVLRFMFSLAKEIGPQLDSAVEQESNGEAAVDAEGDDPPNV
jgi:hypothetical protein